jgi:putative ABC transport system permease protein
LAIFAGTALSTACIGLYAIVSYGVTQRAQEIGMRMVLGARRRDIIRLVIREGLLAVTAGLAVGFVASFGAGRIMSSLLYRVSSYDFATYLVVSATLIAVAVLASYIPARRAMRVDPLVALRCE